MNAPTPAPDSRPDVAVPEVTLLATGATADVETEAISPTAAESSGVAVEVEMPPGFRDQFLERRFRNNGEVNLDALTSEHKIAFLTKAVHVDELYLVSESQPQLPAGIYRIRSSGSERPFLTLKRQGDGAGKAAEVIDLIDPEDSLLEHIRTEGKLVAVIEKYRQTYQSKNHPQCLLHLDTVPGLGEFYDVKADKPEHLGRFLAEIGLGQSRAVSQSYLEMKKEKGISEMQLRVWQFQQKFSDYILGVVSGTLTPLGFLTTTLAGGGSKPAMIAALLTAGLCDGISDSVAAAQTTQSIGRMGFREQVAMFAKTMAGKIVIPCTFIPIVLAAEGQLSTALISSAWAALLLSTTATIQAVAQEKSAAPAIAKLLAFGGLAVGVGITIGKVALPILQTYLGVR